MMHFDTNVWSSNDNEKRELRVFNALLKRSLDAQKIAKKMGLTLTVILNKCLEDFVRTRSITFKQF